MKSDDRRFLGRLKHEFDADLENISDGTSARLAQSRRAALARYADRRVLIPRFAPALTFAASAAVLAILLRVPAGSIPPLESDAMLIEFVLADGELELIEDLDFYRWLDANGHAG